eukprot:TRINITY_DN6366_c0_g1_i3.p1 TRINITY_DN6366_c0_g1~~TRINITY_DN6366_c0_g1_i3.p1  ORF type:complete len:261 (+),score=17.43 TRINITY_DN6366_c0_g1_i3:71-784(+)
MIKLESVSWPKGVTIKHKSKVHEILASLHTPIPKQELIYRPLTWDDIPELKKLEAEWFPYTYPDAFYLQIFDEQRVVAIGCFWKPLGVAENLMMGAVMAKYETRSSALLYVNNGKITGKNSWCERLVNYFRNWYNENMYILTIGVIDEARRLGIASAFLNMLDDKAKARANCVSISLHVKENNKAAIKCYEKKNYVHAFVAENYYAYMGESHHGYYYVKVINKNSETIADQTLLGVV